MSGRKGGLPGRRCEALRVRLLHRRRGLEAADRLVAAVASWEERPDSMRAASVALLKSGPAMAGPRPGGGGGHTRRPRTVGKYCVNPPQTLHIFGHLH